MRNHRAKTDKPKRKKKVRSYATNSPGHFHSTHRPFPEEFVSLTSKMGKKSKSQPKSDTKAPSTGGLPFLGGSAALDPTLSSLFSKSVCSHSVVLMISLILM